MFWHSIFLQSTQPSCAERQPAAISSRCDSEVKNPWKLKMLQTSGVPLSVFRKRAGSVLAPRNFCIVSSAVSNNPISLFRLFDILDSPSRPITRGALLFTTCGSGKVSP